ncbi:HEPN domain-containing protein [candidate division KSB1 bacterium]|nr:HEPN domain-containing protein [candidate division KSB1 bacterium]
MREWFRKAEHELAYLEHAPLDLCIAARQDGEFEDLRIDCQTLTRYKIDFAYPSHFIEAISIEEAKAAIEKARRIYTFLRRKAEELGYSQD